MSNKRTKTTARRSLALLLSVLMLISEWVFVAPTASAGLTVDGTLPTFTFYVPETIYLKPSDNKTFQYYVDRRQEVGGELTAYSDDTSAWYYFKCDAAMQVTSLTCDASNTNLSVMSSANGELKGVISGGALSSAISMNATTLVPWTVTFETANGTYTATAYSVAYAPNRNVTANGVYGHSSYGGGPCASGLIFIQGAQSTGTATYTDNDSSSAGRVVDYQKTSSDRALDPLVNGITAPANNRPSGYSVSSSPFTGATQSFLGCNCIVDRNDGYGSDSNWITHWDYNKTSAEITVDTSRYSNISQIPNLKLGYIVTDWDKCTDRKNYYVSDCTASVTWKGSTPELWSGSDTGYNGAKDMFKHAYWQKDAMGYAAYANSYGTVLKASGNTSSPSLGSTANSESCGLKYQEPISFDVSGLSGSSTRFFRGGCSGCDVDSKSGGFAISLCAVSLKVFAVDKSSLRTLVNDCVGTYMNGYYTGATWVTYNTRLTTAYTVLGNPAATQSEIDSAYDNLNSAKNALVRATGTATVTHQSSTGKTLATETKTYNYGDTVTAAANSYDGYNYTSASPATLTETNVKDSTKSWTLTYTPIDYTIGYDLDGGTVAEENPTSYTVEDAITLNAPTKEGYTFTGWTGSNGTTPQTSVTIPAGSTGNKSYTANWGINTYTVTFNPTANGGYSYNTPNTSVTHGGSVSFTVTLAEGYTNSANPSVTATVGDVTSIKEGDTITYTVENITAATTITIGAATINSYGVTFSADGTGYTNTTPTETVNHGGSVSFTVTLDTAYTKSANPSVIATVGDVTSEKDGDTITYTVSNITAAIGITVGAADVNTYTVKFYDRNSNEIIRSTQTVTHGQDAEPPAPQGNYTTGTHHYTFNGWSGYTNITADTDIYATYTSGEHVYNQQNTDNFYLKKAATCTAPAQYYYACVCGSKSMSAYYNYGEPLGHDYVDHDGQAPTCTEVGWAAYQTCSRCDYTSYEEIPATGHHYAEPAAADWTWTPSSESYTVTVTVSCEKGDDTQVLTATVGEPVVVNATHLENGSKTFTATATVGAGDKQQTFTATKTDTITAEGHNWTHYDAVSAVDCQHTGTVAYWSCSGCNELRTDKDDAESVITSTDDNTYGPHSPGETKRENKVAATCSAEGSYDEVIKCSVCGEELSRESKTIDKIAHTPGEAVRENEVAATCSAAGSYDEVVYCSVCHEELSREAKTIEKKAHTPGEAVRENEAPATCAAEGSYDEVVYCSVYHEELSREAKTIEKKAHTPDEAVHENEVPATCSAEGSYDEVVYCSVCNEELSRETKTIEKLQHKYTTYTYNNDATCTADGTETATCDYGCGTEKTRAKADTKLAHTYGEPTWVWNGTASATATFVCSMCHNPVSKAAEITRTVTREATTTEEGEALYTATVTFNGETYTATQTKTIPVKADDTPTTSGDCEWCGKTHGDSFWQQLVAYIHSVLHFFAVLFKKR